MNKPVRLILKELQYEMFKKSVELHSKLYIDENTSLEEAAKKYLNWLFEDEMLYPYKDKILEKVSKIKGKVSMLSRRFTRKVVPQEQTLESNDMDEEISIEGLGEIDKTVTATDRQEAVALIKKQSKEEKDTEHVEDIFEDSNRNPESKKVEKVDRSDDDGIR